MKGWILLLLIGLVLWLGWGKLSELWTPEKRFAASGQKPEGPASVDGLNPRAVPDRAVIAPPSVEQVTPHAPVDAEPREMLPVPLKLVSYVVGNALDESQVTFLRSISRDRRSGDLQSAEPGISYDPARGVLLAMVEETRVEDWLSAVRAMDVRPRQVTVEAVLVVASLSSTADFGIRWLAGWSEDGGALLREGTVSLGGGSLAVKAGPFELALRRAIGSGAAEVLSRPAVGVILGREAKIESGRQVPVRSVDNLQGNAVSKVEFRDVSLSLGVTVQSTGAGYLVAVDQRNDDVVGEVAVGDGVAPEIATQGVQTVVELPPGHWVAAGSVVVDRSSASRSGLLRDFPGQKAGVDTRAEIGLFVRVLDGLELVGPPEMPPLPSVPDDVGASSPRREVSEFAVESPPLPSVEVAPVKRRPFGGLFEKVNSRAGQAK